MGSNYFANRYRDLASARARAHEKIIERKARFSDLEDRAVNSIFQRQKDIDSAKEKIWGRSHNVMSDENNLKTKSDDYILIGSHINGPEWLAHIGSYDNMKQAKKILAEDSDPEKTKYKIELYSDYLSRIA